MEILSLLWQKHRELGSLDGMLQTKRQTINSWESCVCEVCIGARRWSVLLCKFFTSFLAPPFIFGNSALLGISELVINSMSHPKGPEHSTTRSCWDDPSSLNESKKNWVSGPAVNTYHLHILKCSGILLTIKANLTDCFLMYQVRSFNNTETGKIFWPATNKRNKKSQGKLNPPKLTQSRCTTHCQSVNNLRLEARNNV